MTMLEGVAGVPNDLDDGEVVTAPARMGEPDPPRTDIIDGCQKNLPTVTIAVLTYKRPGDLTAILPLLVDQAHLTGNECHILVVDNDAQGDGAAAARLIDEGNGLITAVVEPRPGIAAARNRALDAATTDLLVFIDDDERPSAQWLSHLLSVQSQFDPTGVVGPVISSFFSEPAEWVAAGRFFERRRLPTGSTVRVAATNNLLINVHTIRKLKLRFDERFGISGGSDTLFTRQLVRAGGSLIWCDEALVMDVVPVERLSRRWVLRRAFRSGNGWSRTSLVLAVSPFRRGVVRVQLTGQAAVRVVGGGVRFAVGLLARSVGQRARGARTIARGCGMLSGAYGVVFFEYARTPSVVDRAMASPASNQGPWP